MPQAVTAESSAAAPVIPMLIGGEWGAPTRRYDVFDPYRGPVVSVLPFDDIDEVFGQISASRFGLQCGLYTRSIDLAMRAIRNVRTGGIIINGPSTWRADQLAYGGIKDSGIGREGPRDAIRDMTDERLVVFNM